MMLSHCYGIKFVTNWVSYFIFVYFTKCISFSLRYYKLIHLGSKINIKQDNFRVNRLLKPNPEKVLKKNLKTLKKIYDIANSKEMIVGDEGGITFNEFFNLMDYSQILNVGGLSRYICFLI